MKELKTILDDELYVSNLNKNLKNGGVIAFVTDTVWGIGCIPESKLGVDKIYEIKGRDRSKPLILMSDKKENLIPYLENVDEYTKSIIDKYFPGALTVVMKKSNKTPDYITSNKDTVGIRIPDNEFFKRLCEVIDGGVLATTSANLSSQPAGKTFEEVKQSIGSMVDIIFEDYGYKCNGKESTVILLENNSFKILRQGSVFL